MSENTEIVDEVTLEEIEGEKAKPKEQKARSRKKKEEEDAPPLPDPAELVATDCLTDTANLTAAEAEVSKVAADAAEELNRSLGEVRGKFAGANALEATARKNRAKAAALLLPDLLKLLEQPELIFALARLLEIRLTEATLKSASLAGLRVLLPKMERRQQSFWSQVFNFAIICGWTAQQFETALLKYGAVELRRRETQRQRIRSGRGEAPSPREAIEEYCARQPPISVSEVPVSESDGEAGPVLLLARRVEDELVFYGVIDDERQVLAAVKSCEKRNLRPVVGSQEPEEVLAAE